MEIELLRFPHKAIRAGCIKEYMKGRYEKAVCFSCGNAARELQLAGVPTLHIGPKGILQPREWFTPKQIAQTFPDYFDATSGHLPIDLMITIGAAYKEHLKELPKRVYVPSGSGETLVCLKLAYPETGFVAVYDLDEATAYSEECVLNGLVRLLASGMIFNNEGK